MIKKFKEEGALNVSSYILLQKKKRGLTNIALSKLLGVNPSSVTKILQGRIQGVKASFFYNLFLSFEIDFISLGEVVYPGIFKRKLSQNESELDDRIRNEFGQFMVQFDQVRDKGFNLSKETGIDVVRLDNLFYSDASLQAYELILIEKAIGKAPGELFELYYGEKRNNTDH